MFRIFYAQRFFVLVFFASFRPILIFKKFLMCGKVSWLYSSVFERTLNVLYVVCRHEALAHARSRSSGTRHALVGG